MNKLTIIGNLARDPELRTTNTGKNVCNFNVAVNGRNNTVTWFRVSVWDKLGDLCMQYLAKGRKVCVVGPVSVDTYTGNDGKTYANLNVTAQEVEFLTPRAEQGQQAAPTQQAPMPGPNDGYVEVTDNDLPF